MLDKSMIQTRGFRNYGPPDAREGFEVRLRNPYYRGIWADLLETPSISVDGREFAGRNVSWVIGESAYTLDELRDARELRWQLEDAATWRVPCSGGLSAGTHDVTVTVRFRMSYVPGEMQPAAFSTSRKMTVVR